MDLKTGNLLWPSLSEPLVEATPLPGDVTCEALVLGAGITGAFAACLLAEAGVDVVVVDRRNVGEGSTAASTALIQYELDTPLIELARTVGLDAAQKAYSACRRALDDLIDLTTAHQIECDARWCGSLFLARDDSDREWFVREAAARQALGIEVESLTGREVLERFDIRRPAALHSTAAVHLDPFKLTHGVLRAAVRMGARVYSAEVAPETLDDGSFSVATSQGPSIRARHMVIATGYETPEQFSKVQKYCKLKSTYALATEPLAVECAWPGDVLLWEAGSPYFYARHTTDGRVIIGGEDESFADSSRRDALIDTKTRTLIKKFHALRPGVEVVPEFSWGGTFAESTDGMPLIGCLPQYPGCQFALGYGGNGITFGLLAAQLIRDAILVRPNPLAPVFRFNR